MWCVRFLLCAGGGGILRRAGFTAIFPPSEVTDNAQNLQGLTPDEAVGIDSFSYFLTPNGAVFPGGLGVPSRARLVGHATRRANRRVLCPANINQSDGLFTGIHESLRCAAGRSHECLPGRSTFDDGKLLVPVLIFLQQRRPFLHVPQKFPRSFRRMNDFGAQEHHQFNFLRGLVFLFEGPLE